MRHKLAVVMPAYNEATVIDSVLSGVKERLSRPPLAHLESEIIVISDGSKDRTYEVAKRTGVIVLRHAINQGLGAALSTGLNAALRRGATIAVTFDSDGQHEPDDIPRMIAPILTDTADAIIGSRMLKRGDWPLDRLVINWAANVVTWMVFGVWTTDSQSGLRAFNRKAMEVIQIRTNRMEVSSEIIAEIGRANLRLAEVPIKPTYSEYSREKGQTNSNGLRVLSKLLLRRMR